MAEWKEVDRIYGPAHDRGPVCIVVAEREPGEYSFAPGFMNGRIFRSQRYLPGNRMEELLDALDEAAEKYPQGKK